MALVPGGSYAQFAVVNENLVMRIPTGVSMLQAAAIPEVWLTAYQLLTFVGEVQPTDKVLVHAGGSGVGLAAVQLAKELKAEKVFVTAGSNDKIEKAKSLGASEGYNYKTSNFADELLAKEPSGVDVILDCVGGSHSAMNARVIIAIYDFHLHASFPFFSMINLNSSCAQVIAPDGRWVLFGLMGGSDPPQGFLRDVLRKRVSIKGTTLRTRPLEYKTKLVESFSSYLPHFSDSGEKHGRSKFAVVIDKVFSLDEAQAAHEYMETNKNIGKIVLVVYEENDGEL
jgi:tumor protein p53-inducible protein 3